MMEKSERPVSLVTGSCGFMGTHMCEMLHEAGHRVRATDLASAYENDNRKTGRFPGVIKKLGIEFIPSDMTKPDTLAPITRGVNYVFHIASVFNYSAPREVLYNVNVEGTRQLCELIIKKKGLKRMVLWGAGGVYGLPSQGTKIPITEDMPPNPPNNYLSSKSEQERVVMEYGRNKGLPYTIIRPTTVYGPRGVYGGGQLIMQAATMKIAAVPSNFTSRIPFVHVRDVCGSALFLCDKEAAKNQVYNINDDSLMTNVEYFQYVADITEHRFFRLPPVPIRILKAGLKPIASLIQWISCNITHTQSPLESDTVEYLGEDIVYSNEKLKSTGYKFLYPHAMGGIRDTISWYIENGWIKSSLRV